MPRSTSLGSLCIGIRTKASAPNHSLTLTTSGPTIGFWPLKYIGECSRSNLVGKLKACNGWDQGQHTVILGDWGRGAAYAYDIITDIQNWVTGWMDWNLCLNDQGFEASLKARKN